MLNFCAIDFETASNYRNSACSVALVEVENGKIVDEHHTLLKPPNNYYTWDTICIHGIHPEDTANSPSFARLWPQLSRLLQGRIVVAHNASFDMSVIRQCVKTFGLPPVDFQQACTVKMARAMWPRPIMENHRLNTVADYLGISFKHHDAMEDARTCAEIPLRIAEELGVDSMPELARRLGVSITPFKL